MYIGIPIVNIGMGNISFYKQTYFLTTLETITPFWWRNLDVAEG